MKKIWIGAFAIALFSCNSAPEGAGSTEETVDQGAVANLAFYGDSIKPEGAITPRQLLAKFNGQDSVEAKIEANINETCKMKGCWMTVDMGDGREMRVSFKDYSFFVPKEGVEGKTAIMEGVAYVDTIPVEMLKHLAEDAGRTAEQIAEINEPEIGVNFEARGVIIRN